MSHFDISTIKHWHMCGGVGSGAAGFNDATPTVGPIAGRMVCIGGVDVDAKACADFKSLTGVTQAQLDLFTLGQYQAFHGRLPPPGWRESTADDIRASAHHQFPNIVFTSMPCKGFSGLLSSLKSLSAKYQALNELTLRGVWLTMEAFGDDPPELFIFENVPRIASRGRHLLDQICALLRHFGYAINETAHDCGEIGGLAQSRKRFLLVARHMKKMPAFLYEPTKLPLRAVGDVLRHMPLPGDPIAGPMHRIPALQWKTWVRLAFVEAGSDWRSLGTLAVEDGNLRDYLMVPEFHRGFLGVNQWDDSMGTVAGKSRPTNGAFSLADPRFDPSAKWKDGQAYGVHHWQDSTGAIAGQQNPGQGAYAVADPRRAEGKAAFAKYAVTPWLKNAGTVIGGDDSGAYAVSDPRHAGPAKHSNEFRIVQWDRNANAVTSAHGTGQAVSDPRKDGESFGKYRVTGYDQHAGTVIAGSTTGEGAFAVADPRPGMAREKGDNYLTGGHYGVVKWTQHSYAVAAAANHDNGNWSLADPRSTVPEQNQRLASAGTPHGLDVSQDVPPLPRQAEKLVCRIQALDGTWHRPFTTLELAALQSIIDPEVWFAPDGPGWTAPFTMAGDSDQRWREGIGNAVPRKAAKAIGTVMGQTILMGRMGETFTLSSQSVWVQPLALALTMPAAGATS